MGQPFQSGTGFLPPTWLKSRANYSTDRPYFKCSHGPICPAVCAEDERYQTWLTKAGEKTCRGAKWNPGCWGVTLLPKKFPNCSDVLRKRRRTDRTEQSILNLVLLLFFYHHSPRQPQKRKVILKEQKKEFSPTGSALFKHLLSARIVYWCSSLGTDCVGLLHVHLTIAAELKKFRCSEFILLMPAYSILQFI